ncbi:MAG: CBS domain-containing protein [Candidatus Bathyarchaeota archaeon]|nr:CBS domain-containing protein [Candidatus Bathyarchaeota archaeon]
MSSSVLVRDVMSKNMKTTRPDSKLREVIQKMIKFNIGSVIVIKRGKPAGIITERDVLESLIEINRSMDLTEAKDIMSGPLITIEEYADIEQASKLMLKNKIKKLPVVNDGNLIGIITTSDIVRATELLTGTLKELSKIGRK